MRRLWHAVVAVALAPGVSGCGGPAGTPGPSAAPPASAAAPSPTVRAVPGPAGTLLFTRAGGRFGDETIFTTRTDATTEKQVNKAGEGCCPRFSPDGSRILSAASTADGRVTTAIYPVNGGAPQVLTLPDPTINLGPGA